MGDLGNMQKCDAMLGGTMQKKLHEHIKQKIDRLNQSSTQHCQFSSQKMIITTRYHQRYSRIFRNDIKFRRSYRT